MGLLKLFVDVDRKALVKSATSTSGFVLPVLFQGDTIGVELTCLTANPTGGLSSPYSKVTLTGYSLRVGIGSTPTGSGTDTPAALQTSFTLNGDDTTFSGTLALNTSGINTLIGSASSVAAVFEIELTSGSEVTTIYQGAITLKADLLETGATVPTPTDEYYTKNQSNQLFAQAVPTQNGTEYYIPNQAGTFATKLWTDVDGAFRSTQVAWPLA